MTTDPRPLLQKNQNIKKQAFLTKFKDCVSVSAAHVTSIDSGIGEGDRPKTLNDFMAREGTVRATRMWVWRAPADAMGQVLMKRVLVGPQAFNQIVNANGAMYHAGIIFELDANDVAVNDNLLGNQYWILQKNQVVEIKKFPSRRLQQLLATGALQVNGAVLTETMSRIIVQAERDNPCLYYYDVVFNCQNFVVSILQAAAKLAIPNSVQNAVATRAAAINLGIQYINQPGWAVAMLPYRATINSIIKRAIPANIFEAQINYLNQYNMDDNINSDFGDEQSVVFGNVFKPQSYEPYVNVAPNHDLYAYNPYYNEYDTVTVWAVILMVVICALYIVCAICGAVASFIGCYFVGKHDDERNQTEYNKRYESSQEV